MWPSFFESDWFRSLPILTFVFLLLAALVMRYVPAERRHVFRIAILYTAAVALALISGLLQWLGFMGMVRYAQEIAVLIAGIAIIHLGAMVAFRVILAKFNVFPPRILQDTIFVVAIIVFGLFRLAYNNVDPTSIFTTSALLTAVIALSLQDTLGNVLGGLALQVDQSIQVGDWVQIEGIAGQVVEIGWRQTSIETNNWETMVVPNSVLVKNRYLLLGRRIGQPLQHRRWVAFYVDNIYSPDQVIEAVQNALREAHIPHVAKMPQLQCFLMDLAENPARYAVSYWLTDLTAMNPCDGNIRVYTHLALKRAGIPIGTPARKVRVSGLRRKQGRRAAQEIQSRVDSLRRIDLFDTFDEEDLKDLARRLRSAPYLPGDTLVRQGAEARSLYIIVEGRANVVVESENHERAKVAELGAGDFFGEMGLMTGEPRTATVVAKTNMKTYRLDKESFRDLLVEHPDLDDHISEVLARRKAELDATLENLDEKTAELVTDQNRNAIRQRIRQFFGLGA